MTDTGLSTFVPGQTNNSRFSQNPSEEVFRRMVTTGYDSLAQSYDSRYDRIQIIAGLNGVVWRDSDCRLRQNPTSIDRGDPVGTGYCPSEQTTQTYLDSEMTASQRGTTNV
jgi:hypothetical protein